jgi:Xaa-Pro aminopeptidase
MMNRRRYFARSVALALVASIAMGFGDPVASAHALDLVLFEKPPAGPRIPVTEYRDRRNALMAALTDGIVVVRGSVEEEFGEVGRYFQNNNFMYLTGCETPGAYVMLNPFAPEGAREVLYLPQRNPRQEIWTGPQIGPGPEAAALFGFAHVRETDSLDADVTAALASKEARDRVGATARVKVYTIVPKGVDAPFMRESAFAGRLRDIVDSKFAEKSEVVDVSYALGELRRSKSRNEVALLQRAIDITGEAIADAARIAVAGRNEYEIEAAIVGAFLRNGASRAGFPSIVGSGINSTTLHYFRNDKRVDANDLVLMDIGASYGYYTADVTRTLPASGVFTPRQREIYQLVLDAQLAAAQAYRPGMRTSDLHRVAAERMRQSPLRDSAGNTLDRYFLHGLSHFLGMDVHDVGDYSKPLAPGDVITIEPGIYIAAEKIGVRIEDDYLVTEQGLEKLSKNIPSTPDDVERLVRDSRGTR